MFIILTTFLDSSCIVINLYSIIDAVNYFIVQTGAFGASYALFFFSALIPVIFWPRLVPWQHFLPPTIMDVFDFTLVCKRIQFSICPALGQDDPVCFSRNIGIGNWLMFQPGRGMEVGSISLFTIIVLLIFP